MAITPKISVVIPAYNAEKTLKDCLESVLDQTYDNYEVVVIDNNSIDRSKDIIKEYQSKSGKIIYVFEPRRGRGAARNTGIEKASGEIILTTDSDCIAPRNWIEELTKPIIYEGEVAVLGFEEDLIKNYWTKNIQNANRKFLEKNVEGKYIQHIDTKNFAIKSSIMKKLKFDANLGNFEDLDLYVRLKKNGIKMRFLPHITVGHNHRSSFIGVIRMNFDRGYWTTKIFKKHKSNELRNEPMFESISFLNFIKFPFWMILQFLTRPLGESFFIFVSELSWRLGIIFGK